MSTKYIDFHRGIEHRELTKYTKKRKFLLLSKMLGLFKTGDEGFWMTVFREVEKSVPAGAEAVK